MFFIFFFFFSSRRRHTRLQGDWSSDVCSSDLYDGRRTERSTMRYMLLMNYADTPGVPPMSEWVPEDARARGEAMMAIHQELTESGELVGTEGLTGPEAAKIVTHDGAGAPVVTDGPFAESKE